MRTSPLFPPRTVRCRAPGLRFAPALFAAAALLAAPDPARANGRYPAAGLIAIDPSDPDHIVVRATYGIVSTQDGGETWSWVCEQSVGFSDNEDPMVSFTQDGTLLTGVFKGLSVSRDRACDWSYAAGELTDRFVVDLSTEKSAPERAIALASNGIGGGKFNTQVFETADNGATWTQAGTNLPEEFLGLTLDAAPSDPNRLYASGRYGAPDYPSALERSDDRGKTWQHFEIVDPGAMSLPYLSGVDPSDPDVVYVRLDRAEADALIVSKDGGQSWEQVFEGQGGLLGFALSPDGTKVAVGGDKDGIWIAPTSTLAFTKISSVGAKCLLWTSDALYACADEFKDGFTVGISKDEGKTFEAFHHLNQICPMQCPSGTTTEETCAVRWGVVALTLDAPPCDGGAGGAGGAGGGGAGAGAGTGAGSGNDDDSGGSCACGVAGGGALGGGLLFAAAAGLAAARRRASARRSSPRGGAALKRGHDRA